MTEDFKSLVASFELNVCCYYGDNPCLYIENSHLIKSRRAIKAALEEIHKLPAYQMLKDYGYTRTFKEEYHEWRAHNFLYRLGYKRAQTGSVNIDQNEPWWRKFVYAILSVF